MEEVTLPELPEPLEAGRTSRDAANNVPLGEGAALPTLSPRQQKLIAFALWRFAADARAQAEWAAQKSCNRPTSEVRSFIFDAEDAEHLLGVLRAAFAPPGSPASSAYSPP